MKNLNIKYEKTSDCESLSIESVGEIKRAGDNVKVDTRLFIEDKNQFIALDALVEAFNKMREIRGGY